MKYDPNCKTVLALETSCDESASAVISKQEGKFLVRASCIASQIEEHAKWGGVVPELASRRHLEKLPFLIEESLEESGIEINDLDAIAATVTPGLTGALMIGSITGRTLSALHKLPFLGIHHLEGHLASIHLGNDSPKPPYLVLLVSGGHTEIIKVEKEGFYIRLGRSHDDAAGEAFDKVARLLGLQYPGGPAIQETAKKGDSKRFQFPKGRVSKPGGGFYPYDFSFSGLKTAVMRKVKDFEKNSEKIPIEDLAASFELVVAEVLVERSLRCALETGINKLILVGGVASNTRLRELLDYQAGKREIDVYLAPPTFCTDNAAMIGAAALMRLELGMSSSSLDLGVAPRWPLDQASLLYESDPPF